ncbi:MAG: efflux RND transporter periplasmic adaptor subunit [Rhodospirillales bacterium]
MKALPVILLVVTATAAAVGGYWFGRQPSSPQSSPPPAQVPQARAGDDGHGAPPERKILYYKDPMGKPDYSAVPKKDAMGKDYLPVYEDEEAPLAPAASDGAAHGPATQAGRTILYYRNPMGLPDTSTVPKKDPMGMQYIPVYADEAGEDGSTVRISPARVQMLGVRTEAAALRTVQRHVRAVGTVRFSERQMAVVSTKFEGWIEDLYVDATGEPVRRGQPLMRVYSPLLVQTQQDFVDAAQLVDAFGGTLAADQADRSGAEKLVAGALQRLRNLDVPAAEIERLQRERRASRTIAWPASFSGIVLEKQAFAGMRFMPGEPLYKIAGLSPIWVLAEVFEQDMAGLTVGQAATVTVKAYPGRRFEGQVAFIYPTVQPETRTGTVRIELPNPRGELKADMYAEVELQGGGATKVLAIPDSALIDNGLRQVVLIERGEGRFEPRTVRSGAKADGYVEVLDGVRAGERVVVSAIFLIDAESNLKAALGSFTSGEPQRP